jgi:hypothetical protein
VTRVNPVKSIDDFASPSSYVSCVRQSAPDGVHPLFSLDKRVLLMYIHVDLSTTFVCGVVLVVVFGLFYGGYIRVWPVVIFGLFVVVCIITVGAPVFSGFVVS